MYKNNRIYGNSRVLNHYAGRSSDNPIWGEVQHSLEFNFELLKILRTPRLVKAFFTWRIEDAKLGNSYFGKNWKFIPIGDPFLYQCKLIEKYLESAHKSRVLIAPRYFRDQSQTNRLKEHSEIALKYLPNGSPEFEVSLHPGERNDYSVRRIYESAGISIRNPPDFFDEDYLEKEAKYLSSFAEVHTNYIGPTLLRAVYLGAQGSLFEWHEKSTTLISKDGIFNDKSSNLKQLEFASKNLGLESMRTQEELNSILGGGVSIYPARQLRKLKFAYEMNLISKLFSHRVDNIKVLCTKCIQMNDTKSRFGLYICNSCGHPPRKTEDFLCKNCDFFGKISDLNDHLTNNPLHSKSR